MNELQETKPEAGLPLGASVCSAVCGYHIATGVDCDKPATHEAKYSHHTKWTPMCVRHAKVAKAFGWEIKKQPNERKRGQPENDDMSKTKSQAETRNRRGQRQTAGCAPSGGSAESTRWPSRIQEYVHQMCVPDNAVKLEVLEYLHQQIGTCLLQWRKREQADMLQLASKANLTPPNEKLTDPWRRRTLSAKKVTI